MLIADRNAMMVGGVPKLHWVDGEGYSPYYTVVPYQGSSRITDYIPFPPSTYLKWKWGVRPLSNSYGCLIVYDSNKNNVDYWASNGQHGERQIVSNSTCAYVRFVAFTDYKDSVYLQNASTGEYLIKDGKPLVALKPGT